MSRHTIWGDTALHPLYCEWNGSHPFLRNNNFCFQLRERHLFFRTDGNQPLRSGGKARQRGRWALPEVRERPGGAVSGRRAGQAQPRLCTPFPAGRACVNREGSSLWPPVPPGSAEPPRTGWEGPWGSVRLSPSGPHGLEFCAPRLHVSRAPRVYSGPRLCRWEAGVSVASPTWNRRFLSVADSTKPLGGDHEVLSEACCQKSTELSS